MSVPSAAHVTSPPISLCASEEDTRRGTPMQRSSYRERDYTFGQTMLRLRTSIGLTQASLAAMLGISRKAVSHWEVGDSYPAAEHLKAIIELALGASAFAAGREEDEIRALWKVAHQKMLLDEAWLARLLSRLP